MKYQKSDHFDGSTFSYPGVQVNKSFWEILKWQFTKTKTEWPLEIKNTATPNIATSLSDSEISTTFINHASHLIQVKGLNLLTDPTFSKRTSPVQWAGPKRVRKPGLVIDQLPKIDVVLISHNHYDHMDADSIKALTEKFDPLFITPLANASYIKALGGKRVVELDWWEETEVPAAAGNPKTGVKVSVVPAQHWSKRGLFDTNKALWGGFVIQTAKAKIFFSGDTGYADFFKKIYDKYGPMDLSIIAIGAYEPRWFMKTQHMNPAEAVQAHLDLKSKRTLGTHFGTFQLTDEGIDEPVLALGRDLESNHVLKGVFTAPENGETLNLKID